MRKVSLLAALSVLLVVAGCGGGAKQVVGTWKGKMKASSNSKLGDLFAGMVSAIVGDVTIEFNDKGHYKVSLGPGSKEGSYSVSGNEVVLTPDDSKDKPRTFVLDGSTLTEKKEFASDADFVLTKEPSAEKTG